MCPLHPDDDWQEDKKLNLILSKVQEHQSSLRTSSDACSTGKYIFFSISKVFQLLYEASVFIRTFNKDNQIEFSK